MIVNYCLFELIYIVLVKRQEMVSRVDANNCKHFPQPGDFRCSGNSHLNPILLIAITIAGSESEELIINQSCKTIDFASTANLRNTFPDGFASLVLGF